MVLFFDAEAVHHIDPSGAGTGEGFFDFETLAGGTVVFDENAGFPRQGIVASVECREAPNRIFVCEIVDDERRKAVFFEEFE